MKNVVTLLIIVGGLVVGWMNRDKLSGLWGSSSTVQQEEATPAPAPPEPAEPAPPPPTPHPAPESRAEATRLYPGLAVPNSALNKKFVALYAEAQRSNPGLLTRPDWPIQLAERSMIDLGGKPLPRTTPAPRLQPLPGGALDQKPSHGAHPPP